MCGIAGFFSRGGFDRSAPAVLERMAQEIRHRGPDGRGFWTDAENGVALVHNRLAIIDLTDAGAQPMVSADGRWIMDFNGEIYNFERVRAALNTEPGAPQWRGHSDSEVLLEAIARWGVDRALQAAIGMFAMALWDRHERRLILVRDRAGEKPLYYGQFGRTARIGAHHPVFHRADAFV